MRGTRYEITTVGFDENLQLVGSDPYKSAWSTGLVIPTTALKGKRYLFNLASARFAAGQKGRLVGIRQMLTMASVVSSGGEVPCNYLLEKEIKSPFWRFVDGNVSWHLRFVAPLPTSPNHISNTASLQFRYSQTPALLFEDIITAGYVPPYGGQPIGNILVNDLATFHDLRFPWRDSQVWGELDVEFEGPGDVVLFASVLQTDPAKRCPLILTGVAGNGTLAASVPEEDAFVVNFPAAVYHRIAGSLVFETPNYIETPRELKEKKSKERKRCVQVKR